MPLSAREYLQWYQALTTAETANSPRVKREDLDAAVAHLLENQNLTTTERRVFEYMRNQIVSEPDFITYQAALLVERLPDKLRNELQTIPIGTLPTHEFNGATMKSPSGEPIIVIADGTMSAIYNVAAWYVSALDINEFETEVDQVDAAWNIIVIALAHATGDSRWQPNEPPETQVPLRREIVSGLYCNALNTVISHEYGHAKLRHYRSTEVKQRILHSDTPPAAFYDYSHACEFAADAFSVDLILSSTDMSAHGFVVLAIAGMELTLQLMRLCEAFVPHVQSSSTHPPAVERIAKIRSIWSSRLSKEYGRTVLEQLQPLEYCFDLALYVGRELLSGK